MEAIGVTHMHMSVGPSAKTWTTPSTTNAGIVINLKEGWSCIGNHQCYEFLCSQLSWLPFYPLSRDTNLNQGWDKGLLYAWALERTEVGIKDYAGPELSESPFLSPLTNWESL